MKKHFSALVFLLALAAPLLNAKVNYKITIDQPQHHLAQVQVSFTGDLVQANLYMPTWRTGRYTIVNQANGIRNFEVVGENGKVLSWKRVDKSHWQIDNPNKLKFIVSYQVYANELGLRTRHIDSSHAYLDATSVLMYESSRMGDIHQINLSVPSNWKSYSGMTETATHEFVANSYHQLASSPIETGVSEIREFSDNGRQYQLVVWGQGNYDLDQMETDLKKLVMQGNTVWDGYPFKKYVFIIHATSGASGATEHINSTVIQRPRFSFAPRENYLKFLSTASHEFVHTWNVKAYRPQSLVPYNYQSENYTDLLWVAEGSTSYMQGHLLLTAELQSVKEFLKDLSRRIHSFKRAPGSEIQSVSEASFEKWIAQGGDFAANHSVNIYSEGFMASWALDMQLLKDSELKAGYKELHNRLYQKVASDKDSYKQLMAVGFSNEDMLTIAQELTGQDYAPWWQANIHSPLEIDFDALLALVGLKFVEPTDKDVQLSAGFSFEKDQDSLKLTRVVRNSPAWKAGLTTGDQIVAFNRLKVNSGNYERQLEKFSDGDKVEVVYFRNDSLKRAEFQWQKVDKKARAIKPVDSPSDAQKAFFKAWTGIEFPEEEKES